MNNYQKNIDLSGNGFPRRLRTLREAAQLSQSDLAEKAGLTYRTVHDLEMGRRKRSQEKTIFLLAQALDVSVEELLGANEPDSPVAAPDKSRRRFGLGLAIGLAVLVVFAVAGGGLWHNSRANAVWTLDQGQLEVRDEILGTRLWGIHGNGKMVSVCRVSPWNAHHLLVGLTHRAVDGGRVLCLDRATGDTIWSVAPDLDALVHAFGAEVVMAGRFSCHSLAVVNLDGDDTPEIVTRFGHSKYYPYAICIINEDGSLRAQYAHKGHISRLVVTDLDADGKDEIIATGTNNNKAYMGATVLILDANHCRGASMDSLCQPWSDVPDSSLVRLLIPNYPAPYMNLVSGMRLAAFEPQICEDGAGNTMISVTIHADEAQAAVTVFLDPQLRPLHGAADDGFLQGDIADWPDSMTNGTGPGDPDWLAAWLAGCKRFEVGHLVLAASPSEDQ